MRVYNRKEGCFRKGIEKGCVGTVVGEVRVNENGYYRTTRIGRRRHRIAQLVWLEEHGKIPQRVYHKNCNLLDCRVGNLTLDARKGVD